MKKQYFFLLIALAFVVSGCIHESLDKGTPVLKTMTGIATFEPDTRISLEEDGLNIKLNWEESDELELVLVYQNTSDIPVTDYQKQTVTVDPLNSKRATFKITVPGNVKETFDLYGVYGGQGLCDSDPTKASLPKEEDMFANDLQTLYDKKVMMLRFETPGIHKDAESFGVDLKHMGSFFKILFKNKSSATINNVTKAILKPENPTDLIPAYASAIRFDLKNKKFLKEDNNEDDKASEITFTANHVYVGKNDILAFWAWLPIEENTLWPSIGLRIKSGINNEITDYSGYKPERVATTGKVYHFFATYDGTHGLQFIEENDI